MGYFLITLLGFLLMFAVMAIGYIVKRRTISGSCGGLSSVGIEKVCDCPEPCEKRKKKMAEQALRDEQRIV